MDERIIKCEITLNKIFFPKGKESVETGEFSIFSANIIKKINNCDGLCNIKIKGNVPKLKKDTIYNLTAKLKDSNEKYGDTYEIIFMNTKADLSTKEKQKAFLSTVINETLVERLFNKYEDVIEILENKDVEKLTSVKGIKGKKASKIIEAYEDSKDYSSVFNELNGVEFSMSIIKKVTDFYKSPEIAAQIIKTDPYRLIEVDGIGFKKADELAQKSGISKTSPKRIKACIMDILSTNGEMGKSYLHFTELMDTMYNTIGFMEQNLVNEVAKELIDKKIVHLSDNGDFIGLTRYYKLEKEIYMQLKRLLDAKPKVIQEDWEDAVKQTEIKQGFEFNEDQIEAIKTATKSNVFALTGISGAGKSAATKGICEVFKKYSIVGGALSGIAGMRLREATELENAGTIHRMLGYKGVFEYNKNNQLDVDIVIIDECTMVNLPIFLSVLEAIPSGAKLIMLGDCEQIPPIGSGQVYADILQSGAIPSVKLLKPNRQSAKSGILEVAKSIISQNQLFKTTFEGVLKYGELEDMILEVYKNQDVSNEVVKCFIDFINKGEDIIDIQVISPMKARGECCTFNINKKIQAILNPVNISEDDFIVSKFAKDKEYFIKVGDKVINKKNNYKCLNMEGLVTPIFNGSIGIVKEIDIEEKICVIDFLGIGEVIIPHSGWRDIELAYACTAHSLQGMTVKNAITVLESAAYMLLNSNLLYTAITRAKKKSILIGQNGAIRKAISNKESNNKLTYLDKFLRKVIE